MYVEIASGNSMGRYGPGQIVPEDEIAETVIELLKRYRRYGHPAEIRIIPVHLQPARPH